MIVPFIAVTRYFIQSKCRTGSLPKKCQFLNSSLVEKFPNSTFTFRNFVSRVHQDFENSLPSYRRNSVLILFWTKHLPLISKILKSNSVSVARNCLEQIEFVIAQRIRRGQQMITLYYRLWDEKALKLLFQRMKRIFQKKAKHIMLGASLIAFDWDKERISEDEMKRHVNEMEVCKVLRAKAFNGNHENTSQITADTECSCALCNPDSNVHKWEPFIIEDDLTVWKMQDPNYASTGLFCYKLYGKYTDVTADDFLQVFLDTENRTKWDTHAADLKVIDSEPSSQSEVIYWETRWPTLFSNRDYVFKRRYYKDESKNVIIIINKSTEHPQYPPMSSKARVTEYWSYMVIKSTDGFEKPGMEFSLTYFDNPGISLPSAISLWVTVQGMPEYLKRLKIEALAIGKKRRQTVQNADKEIEPPDVDENEEYCKCGKTPSSPPPGPPSSDHDAHLTPYDYVFIFSSYFHKLRTTLWL